MPGLTRVAAKPASPSSIHHQLPTANLQQFKPTVFRRYRNQRACGTIYHSDCLAFLQHTPSDSANIVFLDPPFNLGKQYGTRRRRLDSRPEAEYETWLLTVLAESVRVLRPGGTLYLYHIPLWAIRCAAFLDKKLDFKHWIAISMKNGFIRGRRLYPAHYALLMFTKGEASTLRRPKLKPSRCRHCGEYIKDYGGYLPIIEKKGINLSDFWEDLSPVRHAKRKHRRANELPGLLFERVVGISGRRGGLYLDPFAGTGSGVIAATRRGMRFACCDIVKSNCNIMAERLECLD